MDSKRNFAVFHVVFVVFLVAVTWILPKHSGAFNFIALWSLIFAALSLVAYIFISRPPLRVLGPDEQTPAIKAGCEQYLELLRVERPRHALRILDGRLEETGQYDAGTKRIIMEWAASTDPIVTGRTLRWLLGVDVTAVAIGLLGFYCR